MADMTWQEHLRFAENILSVAECNDGHALEVTKVSAMLAAVHVDIAKIKLAVDG
jgi:hypothetical protein